jgi:multiple antibiotic resistance protein
MTVHDLAHLLVLLLALLNPIGILPVYLEIVQAETPARRQRIAVVSGVAVFLTLALAYWFGLAALAAFGISLNAFVLGASLIVLLYGLAMVRSPESLVPAAPGEPGVLQQRTPAVVPLAIPLLAGPGAIAQVLVERFDHRALDAGVVATLIILVAAALCTLTLFYADRLLRWMGPAGASAISRILGMIVMAIGFNGLTTALKNLWPALGG